MAPYVIEATPVSHLQPLNLLPRSIPLDRKTKLFTKVT